MVGAIRSVGTSIAHGNVSFVPLFAFDTRDIDREPNVRNLPVPFRF